MKVYIANFGQSNYLWPTCLQKNTVATIDNERVHPFWLARDRAGFIEYAMKYLMTARNEHPIKPVASRWFGINDEVANTSGDLWIHREKNELWWTTSRSDPVEITLQKSAFPKRDGAHIYELHKPTDPWSNRTRKGVLLSWNALHPKAKYFLFTEGTLQELSPDNADYAKALIAGEDLTTWHRRREWIAITERTKKNPAKVFDARQKAIWRMVDTVVSTVAASNGQQVVRTIKQKNSAFDKEGLMAYVSNLMADQDGLCALTGIRLQLDGEEEDDELLCSLDRIDSSGHYAPGNLQVVCRFVNRWKGASPDAGFRRLIELVKTSKF